MTDSKSLSHQRFSQYADRYVTSSTHAHAAELPRLVELAHPQPDFVALDVATGGGHTALVFAPHVRRMVAADMSETMLNAARQHITAQGMTNVIYVGTDAEQQAFAPNSFDLITCRVAAHHFPDCFKFMQNCERLLKPGGTLLIQDHVLPEDEKAAAYIEAFERLRDPSHHRAYSESEWRGLYLDVGLTVEHVEWARNRANLVKWAERQDCSPEVITRLQILAAQAPDAVRDFLKPTCAGTPDAEFDHVYIIIMGKKNG